VSVRIAVSVLEWEALGLGGTESLTKVFKGFLVTKLA